MAGLWRRAASIGGLLFGAAVLSACGDGTQVVRMDPRPPSTLADAVRAGDVEEVKARLLRDGRVEPTSKPVNEALTLAVEEGRADVVKLLIDSGADPNAKQENGKSLVVRAMRVDPKLAMLLLERGAAVGSRDQLGQTPLHYAVTSNRHDVAKELLTRHADVNAADRHGLTPLHMALTADVAMLELLVAGGADVGLTDVRGSTALHKAAAAGNVAAVEWLIAKGAKVNVKNTDGFTPLALARSEAVATLKKHGGK